MGEGSLILGIDHQIKILDAVLMCTTKSKDLRKPQPCISMTFRQIAIQLQLRPKRCPYYGESIHADGLCDCKVVLLAAMQHAPRAETDIIADGRLFRAL